MKYTIENICKEKGVFIDNITVNGENSFIDFYLNWCDDYEGNAYQYQDMKENIIATLDIDKELIPKFLEKGVFETIDVLTNQKVSIQFYKTYSVNFKEKL